MPRMSRSCVLCGNLMFDSVRLYELDAHELGALARSLDGVLRRIDGPEPQSALTAAQAPRRVGGQRFAVVPTDREPGAHVVGNPCS